MEAKFEVITWTYFFRRTPQGTEVFISEWGFFIVPAPTSLWFQNKSSVTLFSNHRRLNRFLQVFFQNISQWIFQKYNTMNSSIRNWLYTYVLSWKINWKRLAHIQSIWREMTVISIDKFSLKDGFWPLENPLKTCNWHRPDLQKQHNTDFRILNFIKMYPRYTLVLLSSFIQHHDNAKYCDVLNFTIFTIRQFSVIFNQPWILSCTLTTSM